MGWLLLRRRVAAQNKTVILVDTSVIVAWMDPSHPEHELCQKALIEWAGRDQLAVSSVTYAELAAGARAQEGVNEELRPFQKIDLDFDSAWRAGQRFRQHRPIKGDHPILPDFFIRGQAASLNVVHLTNDRRRLGIWPDVEFVFPEQD
jgi:predicted nucleic acid-binding protein